MSKYHILSLDGGGLRGLITVILLQRLNAEPGLKGWIDDIDLVAAPRRRPACLGDCQRVGLTNPAGSVSG